MTRIRIFFGFFCVILGLPMLVRVIADPSLPMGSYIFVCATCALGVALLFPERWASL